MSLSTPGETAPGAQLFHIIQALNHRSQYTHDTRCGPLHVHTDPTRSPDPPESPDYTHGDARVDAAKIAGKVGKVGKVAEDEKSCGQQGSRGHGGWGHGSCLSQPHTPAVADAT